MRHAYCPWHALKRGMAEIIRSLSRQITRDGCGLSAAFDYLCVMFVITSGRSHFCGRTASHQPSLRIRPDPEAQQRRTRLPAGRILGNEQRGGTAEQGTQREFPGKDGRRHFSDSRRIYPGIDRSAKGLHRECQFQALPNLLPQNFDKCQLKAESTIYFKI